MIISAHKIEWHDGYIFRDINGHQWLRLKDDESCHAEGCAAAVGRFHPNAGQIISLSRIEIETGETDTPTI